MALIIMCCYDTEQNGRTKYTKRTLECLADTVDWGLSANNKLVVVDNNSCAETKRVLSKIGGAGTVITLSENVGTARGVNFGIKLRSAGEHCIKIDNDVFIHNAERDWVDQMEEVVRIDPTIGIVGLKRRDLRQTPYDPDPQFRSEYRQIPHVAGERWVAVEETADIMGTCTLLSSSLLDVLGGYCAPKVYAFDDTLMNLRAGLAGFKKCFLPHIVIDHLDTGDNPYSQEKIQIANEAWPEYHKWHQEYLDGVRPLREEI